MKFRKLGKNGLRISEIAYGSWLTHGSQVEQDQALACVRPALDVGITRFGPRDLHQGLLPHGTAGCRLARKLRIPFVSNQPQYNMLWRVIEGEVVPTCRELGIGQIVWSPIAQGVRADRQVPARPGSPGVKIGLRNDWITDPARPLTC